jgi:hypothetical protein
MNNKFKILRVINTLMKLYEQVESQDATEPTADIDSSAEETEVERKEVSSAEKTLIKILCKAFSYTPRARDEVTIQRLKQFLKDGAPMSMRQVVDLVKSKLPISNQELTFNIDTNDQQALTTEGEKYYANLIAKAFIYTPTDEEIKIVNGVDQEMGDEDPHQAAETVETLLDVSVQGLQNALDNFPRL